MTQTGVEVSARGRPELGLQVQRDRRLPCRAPCLSRVPPVAVGSAGQRCRRCAYLGQVTPELRIRWMEHFWVWRKCVQSCSAVGTEGPGSASSSQSPVVGPRAELSPRRTEPLIMGTETCSLSVNFRSWRRLLPPLGSPAL